MVDETDGVGETFDAQLRIALTIASQMGERAARLREQLGRQREAAAIQEARELEGRFDAERSAARASLAPVHRDDWWDQATVAQIADAQETATAWRGFDAEANNAAGRIREEVRARYGIDIDTPGADRTAVTEALDKAEHDRAEAARQRHDAGDDLTASQLLFAAANRRDAEANDLIERATIDVAATTAGSGRDRGSRVDGLDDDAGSTRAAGGTEYDSAERRAQFAASLEGKVDRKTIDARMIADSDQAKHPREAVQTLPGQAPKRHTNRSTPAQRRERENLAR